jgi:hypothetical protein
VQSTTFCHHQYEDNIRAQHLSGEKKRQYICQRIDELQEQETLQSFSQLRDVLNVTFEGREGPAMGPLQKR